MAGFTADLNPKTSGMSLADMMKVGLYSAETDVLNRQAQMAREKEKELPIIQSWAKSEDNLLPDGSYNIKQLPTLIAMAPISGPEFADKIMNLTKNHIEVNKQLNALSEDNRKIFGSIYGNYGQIAANGQQVTPDQIIGSLERTKEFYPHLAPVIDGQIKGWQGRANNQPVDAQTLLKARNESLTPTQLIDQFAPKATVGEVGGQKVQVTTRPSVMGEAPSVSTQPLGGGAAPTGSATPSAGAGATPGATPTGGNLRDLVPKSDYNYTNDAQKFNLSEAQEGRRSKGEKDFDSANIAAGLANESKQSIRKIKEYVNQATGSVPGQTVRKVGQWFSGNPELETLIKNNADLYVRNAQTMGGTDRANADVKAITGSENITAEALKGIVQRFEASATSAEMYQKGMKALRAKRGDINGAISTEDYKSAWNQNADPRVFMLLDINSSNLSDSEKAKERAKLGEGMSAEEKKKFKEKAENIVALEKGLYK